MKSLELKIPPLILALATAAMMWLCAYAFPSLSVQFGYRIFLASTISITGGIVALAAIVSFHRARTTVNPFVPESVSSLVVVGIYHYSRNPMYLGLLLILLGWGIYLSNLSTLILLFAFVSYMNHFQITPEERMLEKLFGDQFKSYKKQVRRWL